MCQKFIGHEMLWRLLSGNNNIVGCIRGGAGGNGVKMVANISLLLLGKHKTQNLYASMCYFDFNNSHCKNQNKNHKLRGLRYGLTLHI